ncbi:MAG: hypothetical protein CVU97_02095 [Firmicutes bacterium HGW-Firmicutes-21]|nr:MAG: hypothetical protein CVU97_02095 [Firmicutes bacterium HGW-Firmicutes-21]
MKEKIYTIPVNEAFEQSEGGCPFCLLFKRLEDIELDLILGASMMEPDIRQITNKKGFCKTHFTKMFNLKNRLSLALMLESHLEELKGELKTGGLFSKNIGAKSAERISTLEKSCYVCDRVEEKLEKMFATALYLYSSESEFVSKFNSQKMFCLPHYRRLLETAQRSMDKKKYESLVKDADKIVTAYLAALKEDISWFCKKFDYRYDGEPWGNAKNSVERSIRFLSGPTDID